MNTTDNDGAPKNEERDPAHLHSHHTEVEPMAETAQSEAEIERLQAENAQLRDQLLRALAEVENVRRRLSRDKEDGIKYAAAKFAGEMLDVADNLQRAIEAAGDGQAAESPLVQNLLEGVRATAQVLSHKFERAGIRKIEALGQKLDANLHEVMFEVPGTGQPNGTIVQCVQDGYLLNERLLRPARVGVAKGEPAAPPSAAGGG
jgi:molecular chaperone GrpE